MSLQRLDTSRLRFLVIQYSDNDFEENTASYDNNNHLQSMSFATYAELSRAQEKLSRYYFARLTPRVLMLMFIGGLVVFAQSSAIAPFIYTLF